MSVEMCQSCGRGERLRDECHYGGNTLESFYCSFCGATWGVETLTERQRRQRKEANIRRVDGANHAAVSTMGFSRISDGTFRAPHRRKS